MIDGLTDDIHKDVNKALDKTRENNSKYQEQGEQLKKLFDTNEDIFMEIKKEKW